MINKQENNQILRLKTTKWSNLKLTHKKIIKFEISKKINKFEINKKENKQI